MADETQLKLDQSQNVKQADSSCHALQRSWDGCDSWMLHNNTHTHTLAHARVTQLHIKSPSDTADWPSKQTRQHSLLKVATKNQRSFEPIIVSLYLTILMVCPEESYFLYFVLLFLTVHFCLLLCYWSAFPFLLSVEAIRQTSDYAITCFMALYKCVWTGCD